MCVFVWFSRLCVKLCHSLRKKRHSSFSSATTKPCCWRVIVAVAAASCHGLLLHWLRAMQQQQQQQQQRSNRQQLRVQLWNRRSATVANATLRIGTPATAAAATTATATATTTVTVHSRCCCCCHSSTSFFSFRHHIVLTTSFAAAAGTSFLPHGLPVCLSACPPAIPLEATSLAFRLSCYPPSSPLRHCQVFSLQHTDKNCGYLIFSMPDVSLKTWF